MEAVIISQDLLSYVIQNCHHKMRVHSVFNQAINVIDQHSTLITLLGSSGDIGPMSAIISHFSKEQQNIQVDDPVEIVKAGLFFKRSHQLISIHGATLWDPAVDINGCIKTTKEQWEVLTLIKSKLLCSIDGIGLSDLLKAMPIQLGGPPNRLEVEALNPYCRFIHDVLIQLLEALLKEDYTQASNTLPQIIGFGPGLTPSTDDFLVGMMVSLYYDALINPLQKDGVHAFLQTVDDVCVGRTTLVSEKMLKLAAKGVVSEGYRRLIKGLLFKSGDDMNEVINRVIMKGASSGLDFLFGFYCLNHIRLNKVHKGGLNDTIRSSKKHLL